MSEFSSKGMDVFPSLHSDLNWIHDLADDTAISDDVLARKLSEYHRFLTRRELMPLAKNTANYILTHMMFEQDERDYEKLARGEEL